MDWKEGNGVEQIVNAIGDKCPLPVVKAKKALDAMKEGTVVVLVDNETAVKNLEKLAQNKDCAASHEQTAGNEYRVSIVKTAESCACELATHDDGGKVVVLSSATMGCGDDALGATLMKGFIYALTQQDALPAAVLLYNGGVHLSCEGSESLNDLKALADAGVEVLSCGTCLANYGLTEKLAVGEVTNMYVIVEKQMQATAILRP